MMMKLTVPGIYIFLLVVRVTNGWQFQSTLLFLNRQFQPLPSEHDNQRPNSTPSTKTTTSSNAGTIITSKDVKIQPTYYSRRSAITMASSFALLLLVGGTGDNDNNGLVAHAAFTSSMLPMNLDPRAITTIQITSPQDSLGIELSNTRLRGNSIVIVQRIVTTNKVNRMLQPGMILLDYDTASDVTQQLQQSSDKFPIQLRFYNLAAAGDAFNDLGQSMVTAEDALRLAQQTDNNNNNGGNGGGGGIAQISGMQSQPQQQQQQSSSTPNQPQQQQQQSYSKTILRAATGSCAIQSRRNDVLEINYEAYKYVAGDDGNGSRQQQQQQRLVEYDASEFRGTGRPYQMVLGSGDMLPGVDLGLYEMCPGSFLLILSGKTNTNVFFRRLFGFWCFSFFEFLSHRLVRARTMFSFFLFCRFCSIFGTFS